MAEMNPFFWLTWEAVTFEQGPLVGSGYIASTAAAWAICHGRDYGARGF